MKQIILDTSFILTCIRQKIDFFEQFELRGLEAIIPKEVVDELKKLNEAGKKQHIRQTAKLALRILERNEYKEINLKEDEGCSGDYVDDLIIDYSKKNKEIIVAVLDREIKDSVKNPKAVIRGNKTIDIV